MARCESSAMLRGAVLGLLLAVGVSSGLSAQSTGDQDSRRVQWSAGLQLGYRSGFGVQANGMVSGFTPSFPVTARLGIGYASLDAGEPLDARSVFINDATNGVPQEKGHTWSFDLDVPTLASQAISSSSVGTRTSTSRVVTGALGQDLIPTSGSAAAWILCSAPGSTTSSRAD
jgi:hypothetical protein